MYQTRTAAAIIISLVFIAIAAQAEVTDSSRTPSGVVYVSDVKLNLIPFISCGLVVGEAADYIEYLSNDVTDKLIYGGGMSLVYFPAPAVGLGLNIEYGLKTIPLGDETGRGWFYSTSLIGNFRTEHRTTPYARIDFGFVTGKYPDYYENIDLKLGTHPFLRFGLGMFSFLTGKLSIRTELYYMTAFSEGYEIEGLFNREIPFNASSFGVELGMGIPLLIR
ncbi:MAG: hypothetical protein JSV52_11020 [Candidatus Zixiibacteriota bacterium]|nr:MAG: hypothetical protein JSV52_11020 [candidate division Zixibacteria bacterium]